MQSLGRAGSAVPAKAHCSLVFKARHFAGNNRFQEQRHVLLQEPRDLLPSLPLRPTGLGCAHPSSRAATAEGSI